MKVPSFGITEAEAVEPEEVQGNSFGRETAKNALLGKKS